VKENLLNISTTKVDQVERSDTKEFGKKTKHDVRAWVRIAQSLVHPDLARWIHVLLTSYDPLDTGRIFQYVEAYQHAIKPAMNEAVRNLASLTKKFADTLQIGRTHGQHALPITVGFWFATILSRLVYNWQEMDNNAGKLVGKISGAVGAYNAQVGLGIEKLCGDIPFEDRVLARIGLTPALTSTQILPPEPLAYFLHSVFMTSAVFAQLGRDGRNLMRSEIGEIREEFEAGQVGSSTMAHKRNPINFENMEGMFKKNMGEFLKVQLALISEHQRDLTDSCVARDFPTILVNLMNQLNTLNRKNEDGVSFLSRLSVDWKICWRNFRKGKNVILAEPIYIALQMAGYKGDAHELVNHVLVPRALEKEDSLDAVLHFLSLKEESDWPGLREAYENIPQEIKNLFMNPHEYIGKARGKALEASEWALAKAEEIMIRVPLGVVLL
jgi:adenylosuccinate lyase